MWRLLAAAFLLHTHPYTPLAWRNEKRQDAPLAWRNQKSQNKFSFIDLVSDLGITSQARTFSDLTRVRTEGDGVSTALDTFLSEVDAKMKPLTGRLLANSRCSEMVKGITGAPAPRQERPLEIHTGFFLAGQKLAQWHNAPRKMRLGLLSLLASQDLSNTKATLWLDVDSSHPVVKEALQPILSNERYSKLISVKKFDPSHEFSTAFPGSAETAKFFVDLYNLNGFTASQSDLQRIALLHNYGGIWVDGDVLLVRSLAPLMHQDWAYLGQDNFINNAVMSAAEPGSPFMKAYLGMIAARGLKATPNTQDIYKFGPGLLGRLKEGLETQGTFHVLPACFFDGGWVAAPGSTYWDDFFAKPASAAQLAYLKPGRGEHGTFAYHWHGRWGQDIVAGSPAEEAEKMYMQTLGLMV